MPDVHSQTKELGALDIIFIPMTYKASKVNNYAPSFEQYNSQVSNYLKIFVGNFIFTSMIVSAEKERKGLKGDGISF